MSELLDNSAKSARIVLPTGVLHLDQLRAVFAVLPVNITFVDAEDRVRFFSEGQPRTFPRSKAMAEFWIDCKGRFAHIRYFALRDEQGGYLGTLEVSQDLTRARGLQGERRRLEYELYPQPQRF